MITRLHSRNKKARDGAMSLEIHLWTIRSKNFTLARQRTENAKILKNFEAPIDANENLLSLSLSLSLFLSLSLSLPLLE